LTGEGGNLAENGVPNAVEVNPIGIHEIRLSGTTGAPPGDALQQPWGWQVVKAQTRYAGHTSERIAYTFFRCRRRIREDVGVDSLRRLRGRQPGGDQRRPAARRVEG
jgi:hypothetical protein